LKELQFEDSQGKKLGSFYNTNKLEMVVLIPDTEEDIVKRIVI
jgi:hypothetical protein